MLARAPRLDNPEASREPMTARVALLVIDMEPCGVGDEAGLMQRSLSRYFARIASTREVLAGIEGRRDRRDALSYW
jgi:hypothetical protein